MTDSHLKALLEPIARSYRAIQLFRGLALCWASASGITIVLLAVHGLTGWWTAAAFPLLIAGTLIGAVSAWLRSKRTGTAYRWIANQIEHEHPRLNSLLLAAIDQEPDAATGQLNYLQTRVIDEALEQNRKAPWMQRHVERLFYAQCCQWFALLLLAGFLFAAFKVSPPIHQILASTSELTISPGDASVERGTGLVVLARFGKWVPKEAFLIVNSVDDNNRRISLAKNLDDPVFGGTIPEVKSDLVYEIEYAGKRSERYTVTVFDYPEMMQADAELTFPGYTGLPPKRIEDTRHISAVEGTTLDYAFRLNKPVASARLLGRDKSVAPLAADLARTNVYSLHLPLTESKTYSLELVDDAGRTNKFPADIIIDVLENRSPELKLAFPKRDLRVSPIEEVSVLAEASDDFGMRAFGLAYSIGGEVPAYVEVGEAAKALEKQQLKEIIKLEDLSAEPDHLLSYFVWADDLGPDGEIRRTTSDLYFAEVRHFDEIFREGQSGNQQRQRQQSGQQGQRSPTQRLAELQKEIINATWNIQRRENRSKPSPAYKADSEVIRESQEQALQRAREMQSANERPNFKPLIDTVITEMERALDSLAEAAESNSTSPLPKAISAEQASYQALLKLQAREFEVSRNRSQQGGGGGGGGRSQQQLNQLELSQSENRYETERQATLRQQNPQQREELQILNRLRELARRQEDLNQRLQELQTALQVARTEEERESVRRELKRLRDEERELLSDVDSLQQRMNQAQNQSEMSDARQQLEQTRTDVRRAAEELGNEAVSRALAAGTRAERNLEELREDFRKRTSSQFSDAVRDLRSQAREITRKQENIAQEIEKLARPEQKSLSDSDQRNALADQLADQKSSLTNLLTNMRRITEQAETAEPLLSRQLYDTIRQTDQARANSSVEMSSELLRRGFVTQAAEPERQARQIMNDLRDGVESAAESVLGDEVESLRLARSELDELTQQLQREIADAMQSQSGNSPASTNASNRGQLSQTTGEPGRNAQPRNGSPSPQEAGQSESQGQTGRERNQTAQNARNQGGAQGQRGQRGTSQDSERSQQQARAQGGQPGEGSQRGQAGQRGQGGQNGPAWAQSGGGGGSDLADAFTRIGGPLTGRDFTEWSDRMRDVEEMVNIPELRNRIAEVRERARSVRVDLKRHGKDPQWDLVQAEIASPLVEVRQRVAEELARRESKDALVPIDRDPVPLRYSELVRRYYEELGSTGQD